jgi:hypothetical protein
MKHLPTIALILFLLLITGAAAWVMHKVWFWLQMPLPPVAMQFIAAAWFGGVFFGVIQYAKHRLHPDH